ncbi:MAG: zinc-ribbon domain-containing protein [Blautia sp.]
MFCEKCGKSINSGEKFCPVCGTKIDWGSDFENIQPETPPVPPAPPVIPGGVTMNQGEYAPVMSVWNYVALFLLSAIPIVGIIVIIVCAINSTNKNQSNYCRAIILMWVISFLIMLIFGASIAGILGSLLR